MYHDKFTEQSLSADQRYYRRHKERVAEKNRIWHEKNKSKWNTYRLLWWHKYYDENKESINENRKQKRREIEIPGLNFKLNRWIKI
jgi:hypothetical protein